MRNNKNLTTGILTLLRVITGWHFLYEGIAKLNNPGWSSAAYLMESKWLLSGFFHWLISNESLLNAVDFLNTWGLIIIGFCLFMGVLTRMAALWGAFLLLIYYIANPPFMPSSIPATSHFYIINYNLIEAVLLVALAFMPPGYMWGLGHLFMMNQLRRKDSKFPPSDNHDAAFEHDSSRRELIKNLSVVPVFGAVFFGMLRNRGWISFEEENLRKPSDAISAASLITAKKIDIGELKGKVPAGQIREAKMSRIMVGGNLISGFAHSRDLIYVSTWLKNYFTDEKVIETLWLCEACGINTAVLRTDENTIRILDKYRKRGGKIQWLAQTYPKGQDITNIQSAIDNGAMGAFVMGNIADEIVLKNRIDDLIKPVEFIRSKGLIAGVAGHSLTVPQTCVREGIAVDFFMKTFHHNNYWSATAIDAADPYLPKQGKQHDQSNDNIWCMGDKAVADFFSSSETPWIAYKILAAGAIKPEDGIRHAFSSGADFACIGMFDFQVIQNANIAFEVLGPGLKREREWYA